MPFALTYEVPDDGTLHARIMHAIGPEPAPGLIVHLAYRTETGLRYLDVWQDSSAWDTFFAERLKPARDEILLSAIGFRPPEPEKTLLDVVDVWH